jgi:hypothetical protein
MPTGHDARRISDTKPAEENVLRKLIGASLWMTALTFLTPLSVQAAPPEFCREYADAAINQVRGALANSVCARHISGARWAPERRVHFEWCLSAPIPAVEAERGARTEFLRGCRG